MHIMSRIHVLEAVAVRQMERRKASVHVCPACIAPSLYSIMSHPYRIPFQHFPRGTWWPVRPSDHEDRLVAESLRERLQDCVRLHDLIWLDLENGGRGI